MLRPPPRPTLFPYTTLFRSWTTHRVQYCINVLHTFLKRGRCIIEHPVSPVPLHAFQAPGRCSAYHHCSPLVSDLHTDTSHRAARTLNQNSATPLDACTVHHLYRCLSHQREGCCFDMIHA